MRTKSLLILAVVLTVACKASERSPNASGPGTAAVAPAATGAEPIRGKVAGTLEGGGGAATADPRPQPAGPGMFARQAAAAPSAAEPKHPAPSAAADLGEIRVAKASGPEGRTVADIYAKQASLKDKKIAVRGKVVKATDGVMGKNWLHVRDGSGQGASSDLTVASDDTARVGDTVLVTGTVHLDRDLGAGYHYDVLIEDARVKKE
jgi:hypothetical protein